MTRHSWSEPARFVHKSERVCGRCGLVKVTRHESGRHWIEWWRDGERVPSSRTPACVAVADAISASVPTFAPEGPGRQAAGDRDPRFPAYPQAAKA